MGLGSDAVEVTFVERRLRFPWKHLVCEGEILAWILSDYLKLFGTDLFRESALMSQKRKSTGLSLD